jgi:hypothetical protein
MIAAALIAATASVSLAQNTAPQSPARDTPRPQDIDPAVNTSEPAAAPARETPRPQDVDPGVNTSSPEQSVSTPVQPAPSAATANQSGTPAAAAPAQQAGEATQGQTGRPAARGRALDRLELDTTQITGNRELPKVLYIVPWKRSDLGDLVGRPVNSLLDEVLTPVDRDVFKRENRYYRALTPGAAANDALSADSDKPPGPTRNPTPTNSAPAAGSAGSATSQSGTAAPATGNER